MKFQIFLTMKIYALKSLVEFSRYNSTKFNLNHSLFQKQKKTLNSNNTVFDEIETLFIFSEWT